MLISILNERIHMFGPFSREIVIDSNVNKIIALQYHGIKIVSKDDLFSLIVGDEQHVELDNFDTVLESLGALEDKHFPKGGYLLGKTGFITEIKRVFKLNKQGFKTEKPFIRRVDRQFDITVK